MRSHQCCEVDRQGVRSTEQAGLVDEVIVVPHVHFCSRRFPRVPFCASRSSPSRLCDFPQRQAGRWSDCLSTCSLRRKRFPRAPWCVSRTSPSLWSHQYCCIDSESCGSSWSTCSGGRTERRRPVPPLKQVSVLRSGRQQNLCEMG